MPKIAELWSDLTVRDSGFKATMRNAKAQIAETGQQLDAFAAKAKFAFLGAAAAMGFFAKQASDAEEVSSKFTAVFKDQAKAAEAWAKDLEKSTGRSIFSLKAYLSTLQDTFVPMGFARKEARELSQQLTALAVDLGSFNNMAEPEVIQLLTSAMIGNHEAVRRFGIIITEATLNQELMNRGIAGGSKAATNQEKAMARLAIVMRSTTDAQGDAARTAPSLANQIKSLQAEFKNLSVELGNAIMPQLKALIGAMKEIIPKIVEWVKKNKGIIQGIFKAITAFGVFLVTLKLITAGMAAYVVLQQVMSKGLAGLATAGVALGAAGVAAGATVIAFGKLEKKFDEVTKAKEKLNKALGETPKPVSDDLIEEIVESNRFTEKGIKEGVWEQRYRELLAQEKEDNKLISREGFAPPKNAAEKIEAANEAARIRGGGSIDPRVRRGEVASKNASITGVEDLANQIQLAALDREKQQQEQKKIKLSETQTQILQKILNKLPGRQAASVVIS